VRKKRYGIAATVLYYSSMQISLPTIAVPEGQPSAFAIYLALWQ
jgi:hypothetical protein